MSEDQLSYLLVCEFGDWVYWLPDEAFELVAKAGDWAEKKLEVLIPEE